MGTRTRIVRTVRPSDKRGRWHARCRNRPYGNRPCNRRPTARRAACLEAGQQDCGCVHQTVSVTRLLHRCVLLSFRFMETVDRQSLDYYAAHGGALAQRDQAVVGGVRDSCLTNDSCPMACPSLPHSVTPPYSYWSASAFASCGSKNQTMRKAVQTPPGQPSFSISSCLTPNLR